MSMDKSLISKGKLKRQRNVLTRAERIDRLVEEERWHEGESVFGLGKVRSIVHKRVKKKAETPAEGAGAAAGTSGEGAAKESD